MINTKNLSVVLQNLGEYFESQNIDVNKIEVEDGWDRFRIKLDINISLPEEKKEEKQTFIQESF